MDFSKSTLDTDSEDELPAGWEERLTDDGRVYYACHRTKETQWAHPVNGRRKLVSSELPYGWVKKACPTTGQDIYYNTIDHRTATIDPRLAFTVDDKAKDGEVRQRFDGSSTARQVLQGRDLTGQYAIVTGANSGIGFETARTLALHGAHVTLACRNMTSAIRAVKSIKLEIEKAKVEAMFVDLASLKTVKEFVECYLEKDIPLHILILNAGVFSLPYTTTKDGFETIFQTNHLGHFYMTRLLHSKLLKSVPSRIVVVTSESHRFTDLNSRTISEVILSPPPSLYRAIYSYNVSKMCNLLFAKELHRRWSHEGILCHAVHPGNLISTGISRNWWVWRLLFMFVRPFAKSCEQGAATSVYCATARELEGISGHYFNNCFQCQPANEALNLKTGNLLWDLSKQLVAKARTLTNDSRDCDVHAMFDV